MGMVRIESPRVALAAALGALGALVMLTTTPSALADPAPPSPDPSQPVPVQPLAGDPVQPLAGDPVQPLAGDPVQPLAGDPVQALAGDPAPAPEGVPHLPSPENLPPGTTEDPVAPSGRGMTYLRELWHAVQTQDVSGGDALLLLTQRPMDANAVPPAGMSTGPQPQVAAPPAAPVAPELPAEVLPAPAPTQ
jgi:resuscitation-promoting factor RpfA